MERGTRLGRWIVQRELGRGGMGVVLEAVPAAGGAPVALKVVHLDPRDPGAVSRAEREARALFSVRHPGVAAVYDVEVSPGRLVLATELVRGESLHARVSREGPLATAQAVALGRELALALEAVHHEGVVHRDVTPRNVLLAPDGAVKLIDFGLARLASPTDERLTVTGELLGTPAFMAPEQADGRAHEADPRTDVYGLGATLYWALAGAPPFAPGSVLFTLQEVLTRDPTPLRLHRPGVPATIEAVVLRCLAKDPAARPSSAAAVGALLAQAGSARPWRWRPVAIALAAVVLAALTPALLRAPPPPPLSPSPPPSPVAGPADPAAVATPDAPLEEPAPEELEAGAALAALAARGDVAAVRSRVEALRGASPTRRAGLILAACQDLDAPLAPLLGWAAASLAELRRAATLLEAVGAERAALRARLAALAAGEADPGELARLGEQAARCRATAPLALLERAAAAYPDHAELAVARLAALWRSRTKPRPVDEVAAGLARLPRGAPPAWPSILAARVAVARGQTDEALALLAGVRDEPEAALDHAALLHLRGGEEEAREEFAAAIAAAPSAPTFRVVRVMAFMEDPRYEAALDLDAALEADPWHADALELRSMLRFGMGDRAGGISDATLLAAVGPRSSLVEAWRVQAALDLLHAEAAAERLGRLGKTANFDAAEVRRRLLGAPLVEQRALARDALAAGAGEAALALLDQLAAAGDEQPGDVDLRLLALAALQRKREEALRAAEEGALRWPGAAPPLAALAMARDLLGRYDEARRAADEALALDPASPRALHVRARQRLRARDRAGALADLIAAGARDPEDPWIVADLAGALQEAGRPAAAARALAPVHRAASGWWRPYYLGALGENASGRYGAALRLLAASLLADDRQEEVWVLRARVRLALGDPLGAVQDLEAAGREDGASFDWLATAVDARLASGDVSGALSIVERAGAADRARLAERCDEPARRAWWTGEERARLDRLPR